MNNLANFRTGETSIANNGQKMTIIEYDFCKNINIQFEDGTIVKNKSYHAFRAGRIRNPNYILDKKNRVGETKIAYNGQEMIIIKYNSCNNIDIQFEDGTIVKNKTYNDFKTGKIRNPNFIIRKKRENRTGETTIANNGQKMTIIEYNSYSNINIQFEDGTIVKNRTYNDYKKGQIKNPNYKK